MKRELVGEISKRIERMRRIKSLLIFVVATFYLAVVSWCIRSDELMPDTQFRQCGFKKRRFVLQRAVKAICELGAIVGLDAFDREAVFSEERRGVLQKNRRGVTGVFFKGFKIT